MSFQSHIDDNFYSDLRITAGSFSRLKDFEECPYRAWLKYAAKRPEPTPPPGVETPLDRGTRIHKDAELYVKGEQPLTPELAKFEGELYALHELYRDNPSCISLEVMWCFDRGWNPVAWNDWDNTWLRIKQDVVVHTGTTVTAIDHKTGKKAGNEVKHNDQLRLASLGAAILYPEAQSFTLENWYLDQDILVPIAMTREEIVALLPHYDQRLSTMTDATTFPPRPNKVVCRWCPYRQGTISKTQTGTGDCVYGCQN